MSARVMLMAQCHWDHWPSQSYVASPYERWWLVEAESAADARKVIEHYERDPDATCVHGRVLASGGGK